MKTAWTALGMIGLMVVAAAGCEVTVESDDDAIEEGGRTSSGGKGSGGATSSGGKSAGGTSSLGGAKTSGGAPASGGTGSAGAPDVFECKDVDRVGTPAPSCGFQDADLADKRDGDCFKCLQDTPDCCELVAQCYATPSNACRYGSDERTEYLCYQDCLYTHAEVEGFYTEDDEFDCADECATCGQVADVSQQLIKCMHDNCESACFDPAED